MSSQEPNQMFGKKAAVMLGGAFLVGFAVLTLTAALDRRDRASLERLEEPTAAGDPVVYRLPAPAAEGDEVAVPQEAILTLEGMSMFYRKEESHSDGALRKAGFDDSGKIPLYRRVRDGKLRDQVYLKLAPGRYLQLSAGKGERKARGLGEAKGAGTEAPKATEQAAEPTSLPSLPDGDAAVGASGAAGVPVVSDDAAKQAD